MKKLLKKAEEGRIRGWYLNGKPSSFNEPAEWATMPKFQKTFDEITSRREIRSVLEVGCYTGYFLRKLAAHGYLTTGVDIQKELMDSMNRWVRMKNVAMDFIFCPAEEMGKHIRRTYDAVVMLDSLEHCLDDKKALSEAEQLLNNDGWVFINLPRNYEYEDDSGEHIRAYNDEDILRLFGKKKNFTLEKIKDEYNRDTSYIIYQK